MSFLSVCSYGADENIDREVGQKLNKVVSSFKVHGDLNAVLSAIKKEAHNYGVRVIVKYHENGCEKFNFDLAKLSLEELIEKVCYHTNLEYKTEKFAVIISCK